MVVERTISPYAGESDPSGAFASWAANLLYDVIQMPNILVVLGRILLAITELREFSVVGDVLLDDVSRSMVLDIHVVFMSDNIVDDDLGNRRVLRDGDTTR